ncbi:mucosal addressin cell adhesion molecule 1-like protein [Cricetulus griseus]|nr:mucosal addressin cell adhesion molecule 1-like protein [Cricetulus griseus]
MKSSLALLLALATVPFQLGSGQSLHVDPPEPEVAVANGTSLQLTCSMSCDKDVARVQWHGLDTNLANVQTLPGSSILTIQGMLTDTGTRVCVGSCGGQSFQHYVKILVYAFPDQLVVSPKFLVPGEDQEVSCTAHNIFPPGPDILSFALLLGEQSLEGAQALEPEQEEETQGAEVTTLFRMTQRWLLPSLETPAPPVLYCQATMKILDLVLTRKRELPVLQSRTSPEPPTTTSAKPYILTSPHTTEASSTGLPNCTTLLSTPPHSTLSPTTLSYAATCRPEIHQDQESAGWKLLCKAPCGPGVTVHWTLAPGNLAAYHKREAGAQAWLSIPPPGPIPEGWFQCRLDPGGQVASLYVSGQVFSKPSSIVTLWIGSLALGLLALAFLAYHLWKRYRPTLPVPLPSAKMAAVEKRRLAVTPAASFADSGRTTVSQAAAAAESEEDFLRQVGVTEMLRAALLKVLETRPEEPIAFLAHYFENMGLRSPANGGAGEPPGQLLLQQQRLGRALWHLRLAHHSQRTAFNNNVSVAYECLSASGRKKKPGLDGRTYSELLKRVCRDGGAPEEVVAPLLRKIQCRDHEAVPLGIFRAGMLSCFVLLEFVARASALFQLLEDPGLAVADRRVGQAVLDTLEGALGAGDLAAAPTHYLEAGSRLGPDSLARALDRAATGRRPSAPMAREEFLEKAAALFIAKVKPGLQEEPVEGFRVTLVDEGDLYNWEVAIFGPPNTYYEGGYFKARLKFPIDYPYSPPAFRFLTKMWHPNIYETGDVCISILHPPVDDPQSGELPSERWNPTQNVRTILLSVISLLNEPNTFSPANVDASVMYRKWKESKGKDREYTDIIRKQVLGTKVDAERDGVKVPTTLAEYCVKTKAPAPDEGSDLFYDDYYEDGEVEEADSCFGDEEDDSGTEES